MGGVGNAIAMDVVEGNYAIELNGCRRVEIICKDRAVLDPNKINIPPTAENDVIQTAGG